jgi:hypothetical protein
MRARLAAQATVRVRGGTDGRSAFFFSGSYHSPRGAAGSRPPIGSPTASSSAIARYKGDSRAIGASRGGRNSNPACLDGRGEPAQRRARRQIAQIIFPLANCCAIRQSTRPPRRANGRGGDGAARRRPARARPRSGRRARLPPYQDASWPQRAMLELPAPAPDADRVVVLESETGSGKTEAALWHFLRLFRDGQVDGLYFALPTRAAAIQIHRRIDGAHDAAESNADGATSSERLDGRGGRRGARGRAQDGAQMARPLRRGGRSRLGGSLLTTAPQPNPAR